MKLVFAEEAWEDYLYWQQQDKRVVKRIHELIAATRRDPFVGIGKPEPLRHAPFIQADLRLDRARGAPVARLPQGR